MRPESPQHHIESKPVTNRDMVVILKDKMLSDESAETVFTEWIELKKQEYEKNKGLFDGISLELDIAEVFYDAGMFDQAEKYRAQAKEMIDHEKRHFADKIKELPPELKAYLHRYELLRSNLAEVAE